MKYKLLGKSGLRVSELCLGTMTFGEKEGWGSSKDESKRIFDIFVEAGGNFIDTANIYGDGESEKYVGEFIASIREWIVFATKYSLSMNHDDPNASGNHRKNLIQSVNNSLKRLNTDYIDLLWVHAWDFMSPVEEVMRALEDLVRSGKVLYIGVSDAPAWIVAQANTIAQLRGWSPFIGIQIQYSLVERTSERELLPMARAFDIGVTAWGPIGGGTLTGKYNRNTKEPKRYGPDNPWKKMFFTERNFSIASEVQNIAKEIQRTPSQVALNWLRQQKDRGVIIPIVGARTEDQIKENIGCLEFELTDEQLERLNEASKISLGFPHDFVALDLFEPVLYGNLLGSIENHRNPKLGK